MADERWLPIPGFEGYDVSDQGRVRSYFAQVKGNPNSNISGWVISTSPQRILSTNGRMGRTGYPAVCLGGVHTVPVHRLVLLAFVGPLPDGLETRHLDGNPENNHLSNLCYGSASDNTNDMYSHGYKGRRKLTEEEVRIMRLMAQRGATRDELADIFNVSAGTASAVCHGRAYKDCPGPVITRMKHRCQLTDRQVAEIREKLSAGAVGRHLAHQYGVSESMISRIKSRERRETVND